MATMDRLSRIVRCPKCLALLEEPPPGTPLYKCGNCSTVLRAKHVSGDVSRRPSGFLQQQNRATPPVRDDSIRPSVYPASEAPSYKLPHTSAVMPSDARTNIERECQLRPENKDDLTPISPTNSLAALQNDSLLSGNSREEKLGVHRRQRSDGAAVSAFSAGNDSNPALPAVTRPSLEDNQEITNISKEPVSRHHPPENEKRILSAVEATAEKLKSRTDDPSSAQVDEVTVTHDQKSIVRASSSDVARQLNETRNVSPPKANASEQALLPASELTLFTQRQENEVDPKAEYEEKPVVSRDIFDDEDKRGTSLNNQECSPPQSPPTDRTSESLRSDLLSPPIKLPPATFPLSRLYGGVQPQLEQSSKAQTDSLQDSGAPTNLQNFPGLPDVLDYDTSDDSSNVDDTDLSYQIVSKPHSEELKLPTFSRSGQGVQADEVGGDSGRLDAEDEQEPTDRKLPNSRSNDQLEGISSFGRRKSGASPHFSPHRSPESFRGASPSQAQSSNQHKQELQGTLTWQSSAVESNNFSFGQGGEVRGSLLQERRQKVRLLINSSVPKRIHVKCRHCNLQLEVPLNLSWSETGIQKLRCGSCWKISRFRLNHLLSPSRSPSPGASDNSPESSFRLGSGFDGMPSRYPGTRSNREMGSQHRAVIRTQSGANLVVPPSAGHNLRPASELVNMVSSISLPPETSKSSTPNTSGDLDLVRSSSQGGKETVRISASSQAEPPGVLLSPTLSSTAQDIATKDRQRRGSPDLKILYSSSDSDDEKASVQLKIGPTSLNPVRMTSWSAPETPEFDDGHEFKGLKGFLKKSVKELTKGKKSTQNRSKVAVNGVLIPDDVVKKAEEFAGAIHPGNYWYDYRAGFWGVMGGPCLGMIPPFIEELNFPLPRHCCHGKTGVVVNGRELHYKDLERLKKRGLPETPGKAYNVDIDGRLTDETTGIELQGLGRLAPTLEQTGRGPGMWVPDSQRGS